MFGGNSAFAAPRWVLPNIPCNEHLVLFATSNVGQVDNAVIATVAKAFSYPKLALHDGGVQALVAACNDLLGSDALGPPHKMVPTGATTAREAGAALWRWLGEYE